MKYKKLPHRNYKKGQVLSVGGAILVAHNTAEFYDNNGYVLDTLPGALAKEGDTVICIHQISSCPTGAVFQVVRNASSGICPVPGVKLKGYTTTRSASWCANCFRVLQPETQEPTATNPFKVGDTVQRIKNSTQQLPLHANAKVRQIDGDNVYYADGFACHFTDLALRTSASMSLNNSTQNQQSKETQMKEKITIEVDANLVSQAVVEEDTRTDLGKCLPTVVLIFDAAGSYYDTVRAEGWSTPRKVKEQLQQPKYLGFTFKFFKLHKTYTTNIPIVET